MTFFVLGPVGHQAPAQPNRLARSLPVLAHSQDFLGRGDVVPVGERQGLLELKVVSYLFGGGPEAESSAHDLDLSTKVIPLTT